MLNDTLIGMFIGAFMGTIFQDLRDHLKAHFTKKGWGRLFQAAWYTALLVILFAVLHKNDASWRTTTGLALGGFLAVSFYVSLVEHFPASPLSVFGTPIQWYMRRKGIDPTPDAQLLANAVSGVVVILITCLGIYFVFQSISMPVMGWLYVLIAVLVACVGSATYLVYQLAGIAKAGGSDVRNALQPFTTALTYVVILFGLSGIVGIGVLAWYYHQYYQAEVNVAMMPDRMSADTIQSISFTAFNRGHIAWRKGKRQYRLGVRQGDGYMPPTFTVVDRQGKPADPFDRIPIPFADMKKGVVAPNEHIQVQAWLRAPHKPGTYRLTWQMVREGFAWFGKGKATTIRVTE